MEKADDVILNFNNIVQWRSLVLAVLNLRVLLPESQLFSEMDLRETGREDGRWMELA
jgi:hypothetical protein